MVVKNNDVINIGKHSFCFISIHNIQSQRLYYAINYMKPNTPCVQVLLSHDVMEFQKTFFCLQDSNLLAQWTLYYGDYVILNVLNISHPIKSLHYKTAKSTKSLKSPAPQYVNWRMYNPLTTTLTGGTTYRSLTQTEIRLWIS